MTPQQFKALLLAAREQASSLAVLTAMLYEQFEHQTQTGEHAPRKEPAPCQHPPEARIKAAVMGHPERFLCAECNQYVE